MTANSQVQENERATAQQNAGRVRPQRSDGTKSSYSQMFNNAIRESKNPEVARLKDEIDGVKRARGEIIARIKESRRRLNYKAAESAAIAKLLEIEKEKKDSGRKKIGYLKRLKNKLEFKISTEASSLAAEKDLVRRIEEINKELNEAYKTIRLERKSEFVKNDIEEYRKRLAEFEAKINETDKKLDELYDKLRKILGIERSRMAKPPVKKRPQAVSQEINLEDIAVIKKKEKKPSEPDS